MRSFLRIVNIVAVTLICFAFYGDCAQAGCSDRKYLEADAMYRKALKASSPQEKIDLFERAFATCPSHGNHADGYYKLGKLYYDRKEPDKAFEWLLQANRFRSALIEDSVADLAQTNLLLSNLYRDKGNAEQALIHLNIYRALSNRRNKGLEQSLIDNAEAFFSVVYSPGTVKKTLTVDKAIARKDRVKLNRLEVYFDIAKSVLGNGSKKRLDAIGKGLKGSDFSGSTIIVEGHTDEAGGAQYNCRLGGERAKAVTDYLKNRWGITDIQFVPVSYGKFSPTIPREGNARQNWPKIDRFNRRVVIWNMGQTSGEKDIRVEGLIPESPCAAGKPKSR